MNQNMDEGLFIKLVNDHAEQKKKEQYKLQKEIYEKKMKQVEANKLRKEMARRKLKKCCIIGITFAVGIVTVFSISMINSSYLNDSYNSNTTSLVYKTIEETNPCVIEPSSEKIMDVGTNENLYYVENFTSNSKYEYFEKYGSDYGVDPSIVLAICMKESSLRHELCIPGGAWYNGYGVGMTQQETPSGDKNYAYNYNNGNFDCVVCDMQNACDEEINIKLGFMQMQKKLELYKGNIYMAIQSHNYGDGMMELILNKISEETGRSIDEIKLDYTNFDWLDYVEDAHFNPQKYLSSCELETYGGGKNYLNDVMGYMIKDKVKVIMDGEEKQFDLTTGILDNFVSNNQML